MEATTHNNSAISELEILIEKAKAAIEVEKTFASLFPYAIEERYDQWVDEMHDNDPNDADTSLVDFHEQNFFYLTPDKTLQCERYGTHYVYDNENGEWIELDE